MNAFKVVTTTCTLHSCAGLLFLRRRPNVNNYFLKLSQALFLQNGWVMGIGGWGKGQVADISDYNIHNLPAVVSIPYTSTLKTFSASNSVG